MDDQLALVEPEPLDDIYAQYEQVFEEVAQMSVQTDDPYWQGKKDGMRVAFTILMRGHEMHSSEKMCQITADSGWTQYTDSEMKLLGIG